MKRIFSSELTIDNPIIRDHKVYGRSVLPGLTYIDILYQLARDRLDLKSGEYCLKRLAIYNPLIVSEDKPAGMKFTFELKDKYWMIKVENEEKKTYITAELHKEELPLGEKINIEEMKKISAENYDIETVYSEARKSGLVHAGMIKAEGKIYLTEPGCLMDVKINPKYLDNSHEYIFHPTLMDGVAMSSAIIIRKTVTESLEGLFIPLSYELFYSKEALREQCYVRINRALIHKTNDIISLDMDFFNAEGDQIAKMEKLTVKRVRDQEQIDPDRKKAAGLSRQEENKSGNNTGDAPVGKTLNKIFARHINKDMDKLGKEIGFFELGLESSQLLELLKDIENTFELSLSPSLLFEYSNIKDLTRYLDSKLDNGGRKVKNLNNAESGHVIIRPETYEFYDKEPYLQDHLVYGRPAIMGVTFPCLALESFLKNNPEGYPVELRNIRFAGGPVGLDENQSAEIEVKFNEGKDKAGFKTLFGVNGASKEINCTGDYIGTVDSAPLKMDIRSIINRSKILTDAEIENMYSTIKEFKIGRTLKTIESAFLYNKATLVCKSNLTGKRMKENKERLAFDPILLNTCYMLWLPDAINSITKDKTGNMVFVPLTIDNIIIYRAMTEIVYVVKKIRVEKSDYLSFDAMVLTESGEIIAKIINATLKSAVSSTQLKNLKSETPDIMEKKKVSKGIAIVGMAGKYPGSGDTEEFWKNLKEGKDCITEIPGDRWNWKEYFNEDKNAGKVYSKWGGFIEGVDEFDPLFFNISPREAELMDPQERIFLECAYRTIEDAGYTRESVGKKVGVYVGVMYEEYQLYGAREQSRGRMVALGGNPSSIANRVSFVLNLQGPSMAVDTACSSSLTAIHLACQSIESGECDAAIAGGVNVSIHPNKYVLLCQGRFASSSGRCESFGTGGDGYVPGEGVGAVLLKPLSKAEEDGDHIYGIIKGSMLNAGGKTSGYTVPNPAAQGEVIREAIERAGVDARSISYIEAHGTGTLLGDPIEIAGLTRAFGGFTKDRQFCAIGSVKSNIGHCESAAGIAALTKVLLQMKHRQLVPSLHSEVLNPNINFSETPFRVQRELAEWDSEYPRIAGISSFGAGGANAHIVIEEYEQKAGEAIEVSRENPAVIILSAMDEERLKERARDLLAAVEREGYGDDRLGNIAYTLQAGREGMDERVGFTSFTIKELKDKLGVYIGGGSRAGIYHGRVMENKEDAADQELQKSADSRISKGKYGKLIDLWVKGLDLDWNRLYKGKRARRLSLPGYPFAREKYWIADKEGNRADTGISGKFIHPLLHENTSDLIEQKFSSIFTGREFFLKDHVIYGRKILPGVIYLEMARAAVEAAAGVKKEENTAIRLKNVVWSSPIAVEDEPVKVSISLVSGENGEIWYEIFSEGKEGNEITNSQGTAEIAETKDEEIKIDLKSKKEQKWDRTLKGEQCYEAFREMGIEYGPAHQGIEVLNATDSEALAKLKIPAGVKENAGQYILHPSIMDSAFQAALGLKAGKMQGAVLPYALDGIEIFNDCSNSEWAYLKYSGDGKGKKLDIDLIDGNGKVCVRIKGLSVREAEEAGRRKIVLMEPVWEEEKAELKSGKKEYAGRIVLLCEAEKTTAEEIERRLKGARCIVLSEKKDRKGIDYSFEESAEKMIGEIGEIIKAGSGKVLIQGVVSGERNSLLYSGLIGIIKTARQENPMITGHFIEMEENEGIEGILEKLEENKSIESVSRIRYRKSKRYVEEYKEIEAAGVGAEEIPWKEGGVYLITGGAGGLGRIISEDIAEKAKGCVIVMTGRSALSKEKDAWIGELEKKGAKAEYRQADVSSKEDVKSVMSDIKKKHGKLDGIIHCAGVNRDSFIINKSVEEIEEVMGPKVKGVVNLDEASRGMEPELFIMFSSIAGVRGNIGQSDYAAANAFMDGYAKYRQGKGKTISIDWGLWKEGGMKVDGEIERMMKMRTGMTALGTVNGIKALYRIISLGGGQVIAAEGDVARMREEMFTGEKPKETGPDKTVPEMGSDQLRERAVNYFKKLLSSTIKLPVQRIEANAPLEKYGIDSIMAMQMTNRLENIFGSLSKSLFFEYRSIDEITGYFLKAYRGKLNEILGERPGKTAVSAETELLSVRDRRRGRFAPAVAGNKEVKSRQGIAIIGISGRYPGAKNTEEFWDNLKEGRDSITEIPADRWDHSLYFDEDKEKAGKAYSKWGGFIEDVDKFDPLFFNISPLEAGIMDPQERIFLECAYNTMEDAGYARGDLSGKVGVYAGVMYEEYQLYGAQEQAYGRMKVLGGNPSSIANRVSYVMNFQGPSMAVDTMCSSSLTAVHLACQSLERGECAAAIAGGVNVSIHPNKYLLLSLGKFASSKGRCESFGKGGDGYVPGEGVGAVLLKPLRNAIDDGDHIYGVIRGSSLNAGGKTNGYTVPNPSAQGEVIREAIESAGVNARSISYIEAHGTGTSLGDPIEIAGLTRAFAHFTQDKQYCAIGSVKSNIGHCESAAGIAAITKVILQMKHRQLVPSLHSEVLNPNIDFMETPFMVQQELSEWKSEYPRIAGISSFGAGGSNAHIVIEEYIPENKERPAEDPASENPAIIVLSARNEERLREKAKDLLSAIGREGYGDGRLADIAYTLQAGREGMEERLGFTAASIEEVKEKLGGYIGGGEGQAEIYLGQVKGNKEALSLITADGEFQETVDKWIEKKKYEKLIDFWVKGLTFNWNKLYGGKIPGRISLPVYPFAGERYWIDNVPDKHGNGSLLIKQFHPLLQENKSDFFEQHYSSDFNGHEFFLSDHIVNGMKSLPGSVCLEMARAAVSAAARMEPEVSGGVLLKNIVWTSPLIVNENPVKVNIGLEPDENGKIFYKIYSRSDDGEENNHCQGIAEIFEKKEELKINLKGLREKKWDGELSSGDCYKAYKRMGIDYGPGYKGLETVYYGQKESLAKISMPGLPGKENDYIMHPAILDSAFQAVIGLTEGRGEKEPVMAFTLDEIRVFDRCVSSMWAFLRYSAGVNGNKIDIDLCDDEGTIRIKMKGLSLRGVKDAFETGKPFIPPVGDIILAPAWETVNIKKTALFPSRSDRIVIIGNDVDKIKEIEDFYNGKNIKKIEITGSADELTGKLREAGNIDHLIWIAPESKNKPVNKDKFVQNQEEGVIRVFRIIKHLLETGYGGRAFGWSIITIQAREVLKGEKSNPSHSSVHGLLGTLSMEYPDWKIRLIDLEAGCKLPAEDIFNSEVKSGKLLAYREGKWHIQNFIPVSYGRQYTTTYRENGIYVVIGGAGGVGEVWSEYMIRKYGAKIVWIGRRKIDNIIQAKIDRLSALGNPPVYISADASKYKDLEQAHQWIKREFKSINGVVQSAFGVMDKSLLNMDEILFREGLKSKIDASVMTAKVFEKENLDFLILFSSISSFSTDPGKGSYVAGNVFEDSFAHWLSSEKALNVKVINWGYWGEIGSGLLMPQYVKMNIGQSGIGVIDPGFAMNALDELMAGPAVQIAIMKTTKPPAAEVDAAEIKGGISRLEIEKNPDLLRERSIGYIKKIISGTLKIPLNMINSAEPMEKYGINSILIVQMTNNLRKIFGDDISSTLFFEHKTIDALTGYFLDYRREELVKLLGNGEGYNKAGKPAETGLQIMPVNMGRFSGRFAASLKDSKAYSPVAIIGMSGRFPGAKDINEYWENLKGGKDSITEIPADRWKLEGFYAQGKQKAVETMKSYSKWGGFIEGFADFDPLFFHIAPLDALNMDPQERIFIESCWEALEDAGYTRERIEEKAQKKVGVFAGITKSGYELYGPELMKKGEKAYPHVSFSSVANSVSYLMDLNGPSMPVDTMCSSSLTAVHLACQSLERGECRMALAGGVNLYTHPLNYISLSAQQMLSETGKCKSFGKGGDGFVPGEGAGVLLLKRMSEAIRDGDHIYGVVRGSSINHGGKTNGYTVPNPSAQGEVIREAIESAGVNARSISYIEAHGTGTSLGDPIEIAGLTRAFAHFTQDKQYCAIGSVKSNIGHLEAAAGVAGIIKILLQMKHRQLVPSLHSEVLNPNIDFMETPFMVQQELSEWKSEYPRIAGISSFGAGGSNAHIVIEEYIPENKERPAEDPASENPAIIVLSARNEERLREKAKDLLSAIGREGYGDGRLADIAYTLQAGREGMEERLGFTAASIEEVKEKLGGYIGGGEGQAEIYLGQVKRNKETLTMFSADDDLQKAIDNWVDKGKFEKILDLWAKGLKFDWERIYGKVKPMCISLPAYPFARERYWIEQDAKGKNSGIGAKRIHPLLHENTSDFRGQAYSSVFTGEEVFLSGHKVMGRKVLPGAAHLEMARAAVEAAGGTGQKGIRIRNVVWASPVVVDEEPVKVNIALESLENGEINYEVYSQTGDGEELIHSQGAAEIFDAGEEIMDIKALREKKWARVMTSGECYEAFGKMGLEYGEGHRCIETLYGGEREALARLVMPAAAGGRGGEYVLHPSMLDGALQAAIGLEEWKGGLKAMVPFAADEVEVFGRSDVEMWAAVRAGEEEKSGKIDIELCDGQGKVSVKIKGLTLIGIGGEASQGMLMAEAKWKEEKAGEGAGGPEGVKRVIILCEPSGIKGEEIEERIKGSRCITLMPEKKGEGIGERYVEYAKRTIEEIRGIMQGKAEGEVLVQAVFGGSEKGLFAGLMGIMKSAKQERPWISAQAIEVGEWEDTGGIADKIEENARNREEGRIRYGEGKRWVEEYKEIEAAGVGAEEIPWKEGGVYLITGGAGGLGRIISEDIAEKAKGCVIVMTGRSALSKEKDAWIGELEKKGAKAEYRQADVSRIEEVKGVMSGIKKKHGKLDGIIHIAGVIRDSFIINKSAEEIEEVMSPKVKGVVNLDEASRGMEPELFIMFSSIAGVTGNVGQADYAAANAFMDGYAKRRQGKGKTISIDWGLWKEGGMKVDGEIERMMKMRTGMTALGTVNGIKALYRIISLGGGQVIAAEGDVARMREEMFTGGKPKETGPDKTVPEMGSDQLRERAVNYFKKLLSSTIKLPAQQIEGSAALEKYGIDSIMAMQMTNRLEKVFGSLSKTLFFEYRSIDEITGYFLKAYRGKLNEILGERPGKTAVSAETELLSVRDRRRGRFAPAVAGNKEVKSRQGIAIIGISGRYPGAKNTEEFWDNLKEGRDSITEIPADRWDHSLYFDEDKEKAGKAYSKWGGFIEDVDKFDPLFFNISPLEAGIMDPQERIFLECAYNTMEDAGYARGDLSGKVGVYAGVMYEEYQLYGAQEQAYGRMKVLGGNPSSIANRVSYVMNFQGPSMAVDTMCSSSLTAVHLACQSLERGECAAAIAGGVNVSIHPNKYLLLSLGKFASSKGRCESFGKGGDGYVPGEGVGAVLLKPLRNAIDDGDHIYGVIRGSSLNAGGKTNGYTVPNPSAQGEVIREAIESAGVNARSISYIEAHGTGTSLGDPIEIAGLTRAFAHFTQDKQYCAIGSVKSNIGHCESAAGIAAITKVILQMKHRQLVPSLHSEVLNPNIDFMETPFMVQQELSEWKSEYPRIAGISSFGAGGSNAHIVIEEYIPENKERPAEDPASENPAIIVLSARNEERLREKAKDLLSAIGREGYGDGRLADIAYTLQAGREGMEERLGFTAATIKELEEKLKAYLNGNDGSMELYRGQLKQNKETLNLITANEEMREALEKWIIRKKYINILELWAKGLAFDWNRLYDGKKPQRISLPAYPFARERYWIEQDAKGKNSGIGAKRIHPLLHENTSNFRGQSYSSVFTGEEVFLSGHKVMGRKVLPGAAHLEMARAAVEAAGETGQKGIRIRNVVWASPVVVDEEPVKVNIALESLENGEIKFDVFSETGDGEELIHSQGAAEIFDAGEEIMDIKALREKKWARVMTSGECYEAFGKAGLEYGEGHRCIETLYGGEREALARLVMPAAAGGRGGEYVLHPSMLDGALQAAIGLEEWKGGLKAMVPFAADEVEVFGRSDVEMWAAVRADEEEKSGKIDIELCDGQGKVSVKIKGLTLIGIGGEASQGMLMAEAKWKEEKAGEGAGGPEGVKRVIILCEPSGIKGEEIEERIKGSRCITLMPEKKGEGIGERYVEYAKRTIEEIRGIMQGKAEGEVLVQAVFGGSEKGLFAGLMGIMKSAKQERPWISAQAIEVGEWEDTGGIADKIEENARNREEGRIRYGEGKRWVEEYKEIEAAGVGAEEIPWKEGGVYLITGGAGGLGRIISEDIAEKAKGCVIVMTGRSALSKEKDAWIGELEKKGAKAEYRQADVSRIEEVKGVMSGIKKKHGKLDGIIHIAGVIRDSFIINKSAEEIEEVMSPKVKGVVNLDEASRGMEPELFIMFSSIAGVTGNVGQADYAAANAFMDGYAKRRQGKGKTISIDWGLWKEGGMKVDGEIERMMKMRTGMTALGTVNGIKALYRIISLGGGQVIAAEGDVARMREEMFTGGKPKETGPDKTVPEMGSDQLRERAVNYFKKLLSSTIKLPAQQIEGSAALEKYGIDSIMAMQMTNRLEKVFGSLSKTLFFEYRSIDEITGYFLKAYRGKLNEILGERPGKTAVSAETELLSVRDRRRGRFAPAVAGNKEVKSRQGIAIIGISGRYPGAKNTEEFWDNLKEGRDSITEIPADRWDHSLYFDEDKEKAGKAYSKWGGFIEDVDKFDPLFFNISPLEAGIMDPQERIFLECAYNTMEDAGYARGDLSGKVGVYAGVMYEEYQLYGAQEQAYGRMKVLGGNPSSIANRVSYVMNFQGPSMAVDTMCSSSLTAVHLACQSLERGECAAAIAGGVNVSIHPNKYLLLSLGKFASSKGRCESFGKGGDGYVPGEGVGAVLLKPLRNAIDDGDHIYGVIRGSSLNAGGKTNGYTVPNPSAQGEVIREAIESAGVNARSISYIEAHGTGTSLGDPIEIAGLTRAFAHFTQDKQYCAIGSVKSNIGHCESAAGIAAITKVILQMKHRQLVPSLHSEVLNPNIDFMETPFMVQQELSEWKSEYPRIAGISSFGAGGSNAHIVIEEYIPENKERPAEDPASENPAIIVLSARNEERLREKAKDLLSAIGREGYGDGRLADIAYTLQAGREGMEERLGFTAATIKELEEKLKAYLNGNDGSMELYRGQLKQNKETLNLITANEEMREALEKWIIRKKYINILELWAKGLAFDWNRLYDGKKPQRISLPAYPFARERYWIEQDAKGKNSGIGAKRIHPLLHENTSNFRGQSYSSVFTGEEVFLSGHKVMGRKVLPGAAHLEMARAAVEAAGETGQKGIRIRNVVWASPVVVDEEPVKVNIALESLENGEIKFDVFSETGDGEELIHSQGAAEIFDAGEEIMDIKALREKKWARVMTSGECYEAFGKAGLEYGEGHRCIETLYGGEREALARLVMPAAAGGRGGEYVLHPSMLDGALQAAIGLEEWKGGLKAMVPFAADEVEVFGRSDVEMWAAVRADEEEKSGKIDIELCDGQGKVSVKIKGLTLRPGEISRDKYPEEDVILTSEWDLEEVKKAEAIPAIEEVVIIGGSEAQYNGARNPAVKRGDSIEIIADKLSGTGKIDHIVWIAPKSKEKSIDDEALIKGQDDGVIEIFRIIKALLVLGYGTKNLAWSVITSGTQSVRKGEESSPVHASIEGLIGSMAKEYPNWKVRMVDIQNTDECPLDEILSLPADQEGDLLAHRYGKWYKKKLMQVKYSPTSGTMYRKDGVFVVIGGAGGIGEVWSEYMIRKYNARIVWIGRREKNETISGKIERLGLIGIKPLYIKADARDLKAMTNAYKEIKEIYPEIHGIVHSAIVLKDQSLAKMEEERFREVLSAKVDVSVRIAQVFKEEKPDFILFFSSMQSFTKSAGQSNYAAGCTFKDAFAKALSWERGGAVKVINWGYWGSVGIVASEEYMENMKKTGLGSIEPAEGMEALEKLISGPLDQIAFMRMKKSLLLEGRAARMETVVICPEDLAVEEIAI